MDKEELKFAGFPNGGRFLCFTLGKEKFAVPLSQIREVIADTETTNIPQAPPHFKGVMNLRGKVISVIDLRTKLKIAKNLNSLESTIVILDIENLSIGVVVDSVDSVMAYESSAISRPPDHESSVKVDYIVGVVVTKDVLMVILDLQKILNSDDVKTVQQNQKKSA